MRDELVGNVGDLGQHGLLRALTGTYPQAEPTLSVAVSWYWTEPLLSSSHDTRNERMWRYLQRPADFRDCDPVLFDRLLELNRGSSVGVEEFERSGILPAGTRFSPQPVEQPTDILHISPGLGIAFSEAQRSSAEHAYLPEARIRDDQTAVIYQSFGRNRGDTHPRQMSRWRDFLRAQFPQREAPRILRFSPYLARAFIVLPSMRHAELIDQRIASLLGGPWRRHYTEFDGGGASEAGTTG